MIDADKYNGPVLFCSVLCHQINKDIGEYDGIKFSVGILTILRKKKIREKDGTRK